MRVANKILGPHLRTGHLHFRKPNEHSKCDTCIRLKRALRKKENKIGGSDSATRAYTAHILSQWLDHQIYWSFRSLSQSFFQQAAAGERLPDIALDLRLFLLNGLFLWPNRFVYLGQSCFDLCRLLRMAIATNSLCCMLDGMDQAKFKIPRVRGRDNISNSKLFSSLFRPRLHVAGTWIHGRRLTLWVADEDLCKNSTTQMEMLARCLSDVNNEHGLPFGLCCQQDNTYREGKNRHFLAFCILLIGLKAFRWCVASFLRVGHSSLAYSFFPRAIFS